MIQKLISDKYSALKISFARIENETQVFESIPFHKIETL